MSFSWKSIIRFIIVSPLKVISILIALSLLLSYLSIYISPAKFWPIAYFGLFFQVFFILNIFLLLLWGISRRKIAWIHAIILLPSILFLSSFIQLCNKQKTCTNKQLKVISYNVQMFQLPFKKADSSYLKIAAFLNSEKADIVCLQEFFTSKQNMQESDFRKLLTSTKHKYV